MKKIWIILLLSIVSVCNAQNLIPNPRFENIIICPTTNDDMNECANWRNYGNSPDYFNACADSGDENVPYAEFGFQEGHPGAKAFAGVVTYINPNEFPNYREFIGVQLLQPLVIGQKYYLSFYVNDSGFGYPYEEIAANKIGLKFSTVPYDSCCPPALDNYANLYTDSIISDTVNWVLISGSFIADSAYKYAMLGNFFDDAHTDTIVSPGLQFGGAAAYEYIADVCVTTDSVYNQLWTGLSENLNRPRQISIYPNPASDEVNIKASNSIEWVEIMNALGQIVYSSKQLNETQCHISLTGMKAGLYSIKIKTRAGLSGSTINLIH